MLDAVQKDETLLVAASGRITKFFAANVIEETNAVTCFFKINCRQVSFTPHLMLRCLLMRDVRVCWIYPRTPVHRNILLDITIKGVLHVTTPCFFYLFATVRMYLHHTGHSYHICSFHQECYMKNCVYSSI